ncbi:MAG: lipopolysaccharide biosynthesis protein [Muribaculaceae bacterium]|nr:lipopolysaccharide biosynthesis protein [Muribaculaceae bacterium]
MSETLGRSTLRGVLWSFAERFSSQAIGFVVIMVMARILTPSDYGLVGMLTIFIQLGTTLSDSGISQALIRMKDRSDRDTSTAFYFNVMTGAALYGLIWLLAPHIAHYYSEPDLTSLARVIGLMIPVSALMVVQRALLSSRMDFRTQTRASLVAYGISGVLGIWMAYSGLGVWSIAYYQLSTQTLLCVMLWILSRWWPRSGFSRVAFRRMFGFSSRLGVAEIMDILYRNVYLLVIGKVYKASDLGYFTRAQQVGGFLSANVSYIVQRVSYPSLCHHQDETVRLRSSFMKMLGVSSLFIFPIMWGIIVLSGDVIYLLLGDKWMFSARLLPILSLGFMWHHVQSLNLQLLQVVGRSDLYLRIEIVKKAAGLLILAVSVPFGIEAMCWSFVGSSAFSLLCNTWYNGRMFDTGLWSQLKNIGPVYIVSGTAAVVGLLSASRIEIVWLHLTVALVVEFVIYGIWAWFRRRDDILSVCRI